MMQLQRPSQAALLLGLSLAASAASAELTLSDVWVRAMPPTQHMTAGYGMVTNTGDSPVTITGGSSSFSDAVELHRSVHEGGSVRMEAMGPTTLQPGESLSLEPGGAHLMMMGVARMPAAESTVTVCIRSDGDEASCTEAPVLRNAPNGAKAEHDHHHNMKH